MKLLQDLKDVYAAINEAVIEGHSKISQFEDSIFTGRYISGNIDAAYLAKVAMLRSNQAKVKKRNAS